MKAYFCVAVVLIVTAITNAQVKNKGTLDYDLAFREFDAILSKSEGISDLRKNVSVRSRVANMLFARDREQARQIFAKLWERIDKQLDDGSFDKEAARIDLLEQLFPKDRSLAKKLMSSESRDKSKSASDRGLDHLKGTNVETQRMAFLAYRLAEENPASAATVLSRITENTAPSLPLILNRIRDKDPLLANYITRQIIDRFPNQSSSVALFGLTNVAAYQFPMSPITVSPEAAESDDQLRAQFMEVGYHVLKNSLNETDESLKAQSLTALAMSIRKASQATVAGILAVLASRYSPQDLQQLNSLSANLTQAVPAQFRSLIFMQIAAVKIIMGDIEHAESSEAEIVAALAGEDFFKAEDLINEVKDDSRKNGWLNILFRAQARTHLRKGGLSFALAATRKIENAQMAIPILVDIAKLANKKNDEDLSIGAFQSIQTVLGRISKGMQAKTMLSVSAEIAYLMQAQSSLMLQKSVDTINGLGKIKNDQTSKVSYRGENYWEDPDNFLSAPGLTRAFSVQGTLDLQGTLLVAEKFQDNSLQMMSTLAAIEPILKKGSPKADVKRSQPRRNR